MWRVAYRDGAQLGGTAGTTADKEPSEIVLWELRRLMKELHQRPSRPLGLDSHLAAELGLDALALVSLQERLELAFGVALPDWLLAGASTPADFVWAMRVAHRGAPVERPASGRSLLGLDEDGGAAERTDRPQRRDLSFARLGRALWRAASEVADAALAVYTWLLVAIIGLPLRLVVALPLPLQTRWAVARAGARLLAAATGVTVRCDGALPEPPSVVVANHASPLDGLALLICSRRPVAFAASTELAWQPLLGGFLRRIGCVFVEPGHARRGARLIETLSRPIRADRPLVVFPEATTPDVGEIGVFRFAAFVVATATDAPVVPVGIRGTRELVRPAHLRWGSQVQVSIGEPIRSGGGLRGCVQLRDEARVTVALLSRGDAA